MVRLILFGFMAPLMYCVAFGQSFEVASVKPVSPDDAEHIRPNLRGGPGTRDPGLFACDSCSLSSLVKVAYDVTPYQLSGPGWLDSERFRIWAKVPEGTTREQFRVMQQNFLVERFKLKFHQEKREMPVYDLLVAKNGPKLQEAVEAPAAPTGTEIVAKQDKDGFPVIPAGYPYKFVIVGNGRARMQANQVAMEEFVRELAVQLRKPVIEATGLRGKYDVILTWSTGRMTSPIGIGETLPPAGGDSLPTTVTESPSGPTLIGAVQEQLGLKLEQKRGMVEIMVIDHVERTPTEN